MSSDEDDSDSSFTSSNEGNIQGRETELQVINEHEEEEEKFN